jgi:glutamate-5-semialdehyde dehydrogenase
MAEPSAIDKALRILAEAVIENTQYISGENKKDLERMEQSDPKYDRLLLTPERISSIAADIINISDLPDPVAKVLMENIRPNGLRI